MKLQVQVKELQLFHVVQSYFKFETYQNQLFVVKVGCYFDRQNSTQSRCKQWKPKTIFQKIPYFARHFYVVLKLWVTGKGMCIIRSKGAFVHFYCFLKIFSNFANKKMYFYWIFELFQIYQNVKCLRISSWGHLYKEK